MPTVTSIKREKENVVTLVEKNSNNNEIYNELLNELILSKPSLINAVHVNFSKNSKELKAAKESLSIEIKRLCEEKTKKLHFNEKEMYIRILNFLMGYGNIHKLVEDESISDIDYTRYNYSTIKRDGVKEIVHLPFNSEREFQNFAMLMIVRNGGTINVDESHRRESDERYRLRMNVAIPPRNVSGTSLIIRKHRMNPYNLQDLVNLGMLSLPTAIYLRESFYNGKRNTLFIGQGAAGKTTLMRACLMEVDPLRTYIICEKDTELYMNSYPNFITQRIKKSGDGGRSVTLKNLVSDALTMSVEGMVVGELVGDEVYDFLSAGYTDHVIYGTAHSSSIENVPKRLLTMIETGERKLSETIIKELIAGSIKDIIYLKDFKVEKIKRINGFNQETNEFEFIDILEKLERGESVD